LEKLVWHLNEFRFFEFAAFKLTLETSSESSGVAAGTAWVVTEILSFLARLAESAASILGAADAVAAAASSSTFCC
jgi:hypothetical protein